MKAERLHEHIIPAVAIIFAIIFAMYCGKLTGDGAVSMLSKILAVVVALVLGLVLRQRIWILIVFLSSFGGNLGTLSLSLGQLGILLAFGWTIVFVAVKLIRTKATYTISDYVLFANLLYVVTVFIRHPVGTEAWGSDRVGGKAYYATIIAFLGYWTLRRANLNPKDAWRYPLYASFGSFFTFLCGGIGYYFPHIGSALGKGYTGFLPMEDEMTGVSGELSRFTFTMGGGFSIINVLCCYVPPITLLNPLYFWRCFATTCGVALILLSGFRNAIMGLFANLCIASYFQNRVMDVIKVIFLTAVALALLILIQGRVVQLPAAFQRALSFLPGQWDREAKANAEASTEWRVLMWKAMMTERKYIESPLLGDGFGFTRQQLREMQRNTDQGQENFMIAGVVHSGPISAIRFVGYIGLGLFILLLFTLALDAAYVMRSALGTPYFPAALFLGMNLVYWPFSYLFIFGAYDGDLPAAVLNLAFLDLVRRGLAEYKRTAPVPASAQELPLDRRPALLTG